MGTFWEDSRIKREEVVENISQINAITKTLLFMKKLKIYLIFQLDDESAMKRISRKIIKVTMYDYDVKKYMVQKREEPIWIDIDDFYKYFNLLMNSRSIFVSEQLKQHMGNLSKNKNKDEEDDDDLDESGICPICSENKVNLSLPCAHFFCEQCIKTWIGKSDSCPLCRYKLKVNKKDPTGVSGAKSWNVIDEIDNNLVEKENMESLINLTNKLFFENKD